MIDFIILFWLFHRLFLPLWCLSSDLCADRGWRSGRKREHGMDHDPLAVTVPAAVCFLPVAGVAVSICHWS